MSNTVTLNRTTSNGIEYSLREGYPTFKLSDDSNSAQEEYVLKKTDMTAFHQLSLPPPVVFGTEVVVPARRPMPGAPSLVTKSLEFAPLQKTLPQDTFDQFAGETYDNEYMICKIDYETNKINEDDGDDPNPETFLEVGFDTTAELLKIPATRTHFGEEGYKQGERQTGEEVNTDNDLPATLVIPTTTYTLNWKLALNPNFILFRSLIGRVNSVVDGLFFNAPAETILFAGFSGKRSFLWNGDGSTTITPWDLNFKFVGKHIEPLAGAIKDGPVAGWNHVFRPSTGKWEKPKTANGDLLYNSTTTWSQMFLSGGLSGP